MHLPKLGSCIASNFLYTLQLSQSHILTPFLTIAKSGKLQFFLLASLAIFWRFEPILTNLGSPQVIEAWGDGLKTYTNTIYHIRHDSTYSYLQNMNYPYGEHLMASTELPGLANTLKFIHQNFYEISDNTIVAAIHLTLIGSLLLCAWFLFLIFHRLKLPAWYAILASIGLTFLAPQTERLYAHFGLAIAFILPMSFYLLMRWEAQKNWKNSFWLSLGLFIGAQFHFYFFGITAATIGLYFLASFLFQLTSKPQINTSYLSHSIKHLSIYSRHFFLVVLPPLLFYYCWMIYQDPVTDRSPEPWGFLVYRSDWQGIFMSLEMPLFKWVQSNGFYILPTNWEGMAYIGLVAVAFCGIGPLLWIWRTFQKNNFSPQRNFLDASLFASLLLMLFACGYPFVLEGWEHWLEYAGPIKQFRSIGRFAWVFYFAINILAFAGFYQWLSKWRWKWLKILGFVTLFSVLFYEAYTFTILKKLRLQSIPHFKKGTQYNDIKSLDFTQYQATVPIPYFNIGSNNFEMGAEGFCTQRAFVIAAQTGLPTTAAMLTRTSRNQILKQWQLLKAPYRTPIILDDFDSKKPLLLIWWTGMKPAIASEYQHLLQQATLVFEEGEMQLYELPLPIFENKVEKELEAIQSALASDTLHFHFPFLSSKKKKDFLFLSFDEPKTEKKYVGWGAYQGTTFKDNLLLNDTLPNAQTGVNYQLSTWFFVNADRNSRALFHLKELNKKGVILQELKFHVWPNIHTFDTNGWALLEKTFQLKSSDSHLQLSVTGDWEKETSFWLDELLIKPIDTELYLENEEMWWRDNLYYLK